MLHDNSNVFQTGGIVLTFSAFLRPELEYAYLTFDFEIILLQNSLYS